MRMDEAGHPGTPAEVLAVALRLGLTSFGGPIAHLGYYRAELVARRAWLDEAEFADLLALCQFLPGPASSQTLFAIGLLRAGWAGGLAAWVGFTLPSAALMLGFAWGAGWLGASAAGAGLLRGLRLVAVAIVAQAVWGMAQKLCPDRARASIAVASAVLVLLVAGAPGQLGAIALGGIAGLLVCRGEAPAMVGHLRAMSRAWGAACLAIFAVLLVGLPLLRGTVPGAPLFEAFYRSGALVFGGGHVVLPLLRDAVVQPGWVSDQAFLAGYGAAQAVPGPVFSFAAYLGAIAATPPGGLAGGSLAVLAIFLPGLLLVAGALPFWDAFRRRPRAQAVMRGVNAAVVGLLGAALYQPVWTSSVHSPADFALALVGFALLTAWRAPSLLVVLLGAATGAAAGLVG